MILAARLVPIMGDVTVPTLVVILPLCMIASAWWWIACRAVLAAVEPVYWRRYARRLARRSGMTIDEAQAFIAKARRELEAFRAGR